MPDWGFKVSQPGADIGTALDRDLVYSSKFDSTAGSQTLFGTASQTIGTGTKGTYTITHGLGYNPAFDAWWKCEFGEWHSFFYSIIISPNFHRAIADNYNMGTNTFVLVISNTAGTVSQTIPIFYTIYKNQI